MNHAFEQSDDQPKIKSIIEVFQERIDALDPSAPDYRAARRSLIAQRNHTALQTEMIDDRPLLPYEDAAADPAMKVTPWDSLVIDESTMMQPDEIVSWVESQEVADPMLWDKMDFTPDMTADDKMLRMLMRGHIQPIE